MPMGSAMTLVDRLNRAIDAHLKWKARLMLIIDSGESILATGVVCSDNRCELGRWLYSLDESITKTHRWKWVRAKHSEFHQEAAHVLELALSGNQKEARKKISYLSKYDGISSRLIDELNAWKKEATRFTPETEVKTLFLEESAETNPQECLTAR